MNLKNILETIKNDIPKIISLKNKIKNIRKKDNKLFFGFYIPIVIFPSIALIRALGEDFTKGGDKIHYIPAIMIGFILMVTLTYFFTKIAELAARYNARSKNRTKINKINSSILTNISFEYKNELKEIINNNEELSDIVKSTKSTYFNNSKQTEEDLICNIFESYLKKEYCTMETLEDLIIFSKNNFNKKLKNKLIFGVMSLLIHKIERNDFFKHKNRLIDLALNNLNTENQQNITKEIKQKLNEYNKEEKIEKETVNELLLLKKETDMYLIKDQVSINNEKQAIVKNI